MRLQDRVWAPSPPTPLEQIRAEMDAIRQARGHDIPTTCLACGTRLPDACAWHPWEQCLGAKEGC